MTQDDRYLVVNPFFHSFGYKAGWLSCLIKGAAIFPLAVYNPKDVLQRIERDKITVMPGAPTIFQTLLKHPDLNEHDISSLRVATTGATTIPVDLIQRMHKELGIDDVFSAYGLTESTGVVSLCKKGDDFETIATTCGRPLPGTELRLVNDMGEDVGEGEEGEIWVRGFNVMKGYLDDDEATSQAITPEGWLKTGDIGTQNASGYIKITDRKKDDERLGEVTAAHVVTAADLSKEGLVSWCRETMANYKVPRHIVFHDVLPRNASGKVMKFLLKT